MLECCNVTFSYGKKNIFNNFSFTLGDGEILALMGPSGCGKTTLLRLIAGLETPTKDSIIRSSFQKITYVFQEPRLFPWLTVKENLRVVLPTQREPDSVIDAIMDRVDLKGAGDLYPHELSGGMKSRASLARAMLYDGDLYLLDEPFAALDDGLRRSLSEILYTHIKERGASAILVTHQFADAHAIADRILQL